MGLFDLFIKKKEEPVPAVAPEPVKESRNVQGHKVVGCNYRQDVLQTLGSANPNYTLKKTELIKKNLIDTCIYEYTFPVLEAELVPEPTNEYDSNAIMVLVDGNLIGYIKAGSCSRVKKLIDSNSIKKIDAIIYGGNYKAVELCENGAHSMSSRKGEIRVRLEIETE